MRIKITRDIPGYKAGEIVGSDNVSFGVHLTKDMKEQVYYQYQYLIDNGFAEEVRETVDIDEIRSKFRKSTYLGGEEELKYMTYIELNFFTAYRIVKEVITRLNGGWEADWEDNDQRKWIIRFNYLTSRFDSDWFTYVQSSQLPYCKDEETAQKVIELCEPELRVLFNIK